jgi:nicotinate phosphoribosyltransferase
MNTLAALYRPSLALLTDLYELTMAYGYWKVGMSEREAVFHLVFRENPFGSGFSIACGLETALEYLERFRFDDSDLAYLASLRGANGQPLFEPAFCEYLHDLPLALDVDAVPEGTVVFPHEPLIRVKGPLIQSQIVETALLTILNFQTLIATKAARVVLAAQGEPVLEFGLRRAQGVDGGVSASRAAYIGGCASTSNLLAGKLYGIPVKGTHAHSWVMSFDNEQEAFCAYAKAMPNNAVFLVDTYNTLDGVRHAVEVGRWLRSQGHEMLGIRLDSGDLAYLSIEARKILDEAGFPNAMIVGSGDLDEHIITSLKSQGATINVWGVGTRLTTGYDQPALGGVYKLSAIEENGHWKDRVKLSEQLVKTSNPGILQVRRYFRNGEAVGDAIYDLQHPISDGCAIVDPTDITRRKIFSSGEIWNDLLVSVFRNGRRTYQRQPLDQIRERTQQQLTLFHSGIKRFVNPHRYPVGLEIGLHERKTELILRQRGFA